MTKTICPGCGHENVERSRGVCDVCGKLLSEGFQPLDSIRSSYGMQRKRVEFPSVREPDEPLFQKSRTLVSDTAWACTVYSMVPYLGILFIPLALGVGTAGYLTNRGRPERASERRSLLSVGVSLVLLIVQLILWWLLYLIPEIGI